MRHGEVVEAGDSEGIFTSPREEYTKELMAATPTLPGTR
jgi:ABC-type microcin C transport system duplicated ATPase subunit YejF